MLKRFLRRKGKGEGEGEGSSGKEEKDRVDDGVGEEVLSGEDGPAVNGDGIEPGEEGTRDSLEEEEEAVGAVDTDGLRAARARLSLDDGSIRPKPQGETVRVEEEEEGEDDPIAAAPQEPNTISEGPSEYAEGRLAHKETCTLPIEVGTCGKAGWEPLRGPNRRRSVEVRKENQDAFLALTPFENMDGQLLLGVFDGHGAEGRKISHCARDSVCKSLMQYHSEPEKLQLAIPESESEKDKTDIHKRRASYLKDAFRTAEVEISNRARGIDHQFSGTTCVLTWVFETDMYCAWVGDSRGVLGRSTGTTRDAKHKAVELSHDQKPIRSDEKKRVRAAGGRIARWRKDIGPLRVWVPTEWIPGLAMTRSIGDTVLSSFGVIPDPEVTYTRLTSADSFLIMASDGVWEFMTSQEAVDFVTSKRREKGTADAVAEALVREAVRRWRRHEEVVDDTTVVLVFFNFESGAEKDAGKSFFAFGKSGGSRPVNVTYDGRVSTFMPKNE